MRSVPEKNRTTKHGPGLAALTPEPTLRYTLREAGAMTTEGLSPEDPHLLQLVRSFAADETLLRVCRAVVHCESGYPDPQNHL